MLFRKQTKLTQDERKTFEEAYERIKNVCYSVALKITHDTGLAEDALQSAFEKIMEHKDKYYSIPCLKRDAYIVIIVKNKAIDIMRGKKNTASTWDDMTEEVLENFSFSDVEETVVNNDSYNQLDEMVNALPQIYRDVFRMKYVDGFSALMFNDDVRAAVFERFDWLSRFFVVEFQGMDDESARLTIWRPNYFPNGFNVLEDFYHFDEYNSSAVIVYVDNEYGHADPDGRTIFWGKTWIHHGYGPLEGVLAFRENVDYSTIVNNGITYHIFVSHSNDIMCRIIWEYGGFAFNVEGMNVDIDLLMKIALSTDVAEERG